MAFSSGEKDGFNETISKVLQVYRTLVTIYKIQVQPFRWRLNPDSEIFKSIPLLLGALMSAGFNMIHVMIWLLSLASTSLLVGDDTS